jgi:hypothetical protein
MGTLLLAILLTAAGPEMQVQPLEGPAVAGTLVELSAERVTIETPGGRVSLETSKLMGISPKQKPEEKKADALIELVDGSTLVAREYAALDRKARVTLADDEVLEIPTRDIATVRLQASTEALGKEWSRILGMKTDTDLLVVRKGDVLDYHKGVLGDVSDKVVNFTLDGDKIPVKRPKVFGMAYYHAGGRELPAAVCQLTDNTGSRWSVRTIEMADGLRLTTPAGISVKRPLERVSYLDFSGGKIIYLSDMKAESAKYTAYIEPAPPAQAELWAPRQDHNLEGKPLQVAGKQYSKGLWLHSRTEMVYRLPGRFSRLKAVAGIDDAVRSERIGNVDLVIRGDDKVLLKVTITCEDPPKPLDLDLTGVRRLGILVDFGANTDVGDHLDLCDARIIK